MVCNVVMRVTKGIGLNREEIMNNPFPSNCPLLKDK